MRLAIHLLTLFAGLSYAASTKMAPELQTQRSNEKIDVIVRFKQPPTAAHFNRAAQNGGELKQNLGFIQSAHYQIRANQLDALANDPDVEYISPDRAVTATSSNLLYNGSPDYGWRTVGADLASSVFGADGTGVGIALIDSGVDVLMDLKDANGRDRVVYRTTLVPNSPATDSYGHGDHVAGILAGNGSDSSGSTFTYLVRGIAPNAHIVSFRVLDDHGAGTDSAVIAAIQQAIALRSKYNIRVMNISLGRPVTTSYVNDALCQAVQQAWQAGIVVVVAAGNSGRDNSHGTNGYGSISAPGNSPYVITVGAMNTVGTLTPTDDKIASYSSKGPTAIDHIIKPDLVAPGNRVFSLTEGTTWFDKTYPGNAVSKSDISTQHMPAPSGYFAMSGTSMAAPMVSGAAALMLQKNPGLTPDEVKSRLMKTAAKFAPGISTATDPVTGATYTDEYDVFTVGAGYLSIPAALADYDTLLGPALSPTAVYNTTSNEVDLEPNGLAAISGTAATWGTRSGLWSASAIWGTSIFVNAGAAIWGSGSVWGTAAIWGTSTPGAFAAIWGSSAIWGTSQDATEATAVAVNGDN